MICAIVLAGGLSRRMGPDNKLAQDVAGKPLLDWAISAATHCKAETTIIVYGNWRPPTDDSITLVHAPDAQNGQSRSLAAGLIHADEIGAHAAIVLLGDMPLIRARDIDTILDAATSQPDAIMRPSYDGTPGHPVYWPKWTFPNLIALHGDEGAKPFLKAHRQDVQVLDWADDTVTFDVDTPSALDEARRRLALLKP
ncbi:MAG: nucleotidyltransferase family protein [Pseudomonadota bacterium]